MQTFYRISWSLTAAFFLIGAVVIFSLNFLAPCVKQGIEGFCEISTGMKAEINSPAEVYVFEFEPFTVSYTTANGETQEITSPQAYLFYQIHLVTTGPVTIQMLNSRGGFDHPLIRFESQGPTTLKVYHTWDQPITQFFQWYMVEMFGVWLIIGSMFFLAALFAWFGKFD